MDRDPHRPDRRRPHRRDAFGGAAHDRRRDARTRSSSVAVADPVGGEPRAVRQRCTATAMPTPMRAICSARADVDAVFVCTPTAFHAELVRDGGRGRQASLLREAAGDVARRGAATMLDAVRARRRQGADRPGAALLVRLHRHARPAALGRGRRADGGGVPRRPGASRSAACTTPPGARTAASPPAER